jgi:hypothetical protein
MYRIGASYVRPGVESPARSPLGLRVTPSSMSNPGVASPMYASSMMWRSAASASRWRVSPSRMSNAAGNTPSVNSFTNVWAKKSPAACVA